MTPTPEQLQTKRSELILQQLEQLPTLPPVALRVLEVTASDTSSVKDVVQLISSDLAVTSRILQLVHRADVAISGQVTTIDRAVVLLGFQAVRSAVLAVSIYQTFAGAGGAPGRSHFVRDEFWKHCVGVACCAELLAEAHVAAVGKAAADCDPAEAFVCGLLHDIGKVALDVCLPKSFDRVVEATDLLRGDIADLERQVIGIDHMVVGKRLAERWQLPPVIRDCAWLHGQAPAALPATVKSPRMVNLVTLADLIVREQHLGYSGNYAFSVSRQVVAEAVGLSAEAIEKITAELVHRVEPRAKALGLGGTNANELYQQALAQANRELGRVSGQLATKNRRLAVRAKFFDALSGFQAGMRPDAPPQTVLEAIGQTACSVLGVKAAAAFSLLPGQGFAEVLLLDDSGEAVQSTVVDCPSRPMAGPASDSPILGVGQELEWLLAAVGPALQDDQRYWLRLEADGVCIGEAWGGPAGEAQRLSPQVQELAVILSGWSLALRTAQIREEARRLAEQLAEANRQLQSAQSELLRRRTMMSVGEMAAGAAHEMNNPLAVISGRSQLLAAQLADAKQKAAATQIFENSHRLSEIITELMDFAKPQPPKPVKTSAVALIERALQTAKNRCDPADRSFEVVLADLPELMVDPDQVTRAIEEVIDNSIQATSPVHGKIGIHGAFDPYSGRVVLTISDNGCGMDEATQRRAFDPFFSSKTAGRRRGLGLAKALRWIEASGGNIRLESQVDLGTRTSILLPAPPIPADEAQAPERKIAR